MNVTVNEERPFEIPIENDADCFMLMRSVNVANRESV